MGTFIQGPPVDWSCHLVVRERADKAGSSHKAEFLDDPAFDAVRESF